MFAEEVVNESASIVSPRAASVKAALTAGALQSAVSVLSPWKQGLENNKAGASSTSEEDDDTEDDEEASAPRSGGGEGKKLAKTAATLQCQISRNYSLPNGAPDATITDENFNEIDSSNSNSAKEIHVCCVVDGCQKGHP